MVAKKYLVSVIVIMVLTLSLTACSFRSSSSGSETKAATEASVQNVSIQDIEQSKKVIEGYFTKMYASADKFYNNNVTGTIPSELKEYIAQRTLKESNGNPESGIHYPRIVNVNGLNIVQYTIDKKRLQFQTSFLAKSGDNNIFSVKVPLEGKCADDSTLNLLYKENPDHSYTPTGAINNLLETMRLYAKYEVDVVKENGKFKILDAREASEKKGYTRRISRANNDYIERMPYLFIDSTVGKDYKPVDADKKIYDSEKKVVEGFFTMIRGIDRTRMNMLGKAWNSGDSAAVYSVLNNFDLPKYDGLKNKKVLDLMALDKDYKDRFDLLSFPLQNDMESINQIKSITVVPHASYSDKKKRYVVSLDTLVHKTSGVFDNSLGYKYSYYVELTAESDKIARIRLQECYRAE